MELSISSHPHILEFKASFLTPHYLAMVTEYIEGETLESFLEKIGGRVIEGLARFIFQQLVVAVDFCHRTHKVLRDLKLSNTLLVLSEGQLPIVKLCDFSVSKDLLREPDLPSQVGTVLFAAPEVLQSQSAPGDEGKAADMWACGVILYIMLFGRHPFLRDEDAALSPEHRMVAMLQRILRGDAEYPPDICTSLSPACLDLLHKMLVVDPVKRLNVRQIMGHPFFLESLPEGAASMNQVFVANSQRLTDCEIMQFRALVHKASLDDKQCVLDVAELQGVQGLPLPLGIGSQDEAGPEDPAAATAALQHQQPPVNQSVSTSSHDSALTTPPPAGNRPAVPAAPTPLAPAPSPPPPAAPGRTFRLSTGSDHYVSISISLPQQDNSNAAEQQQQQVGGSSRRPRSGAAPEGSGGRVVAHLPPRLELQAAGEVRPMSSVSAGGTRPASNASAGGARPVSNGSARGLLSPMSLGGFPSPRHALESGLVNLEDAIMNMPSTDLLLAATEDIIGPGNPVSAAAAGGALMDIHAGLSPGIPRSRSELEADLMHSSSFMREFNQARLWGLVSSGSGSGAALNVISEYVTDRAFSYDGNASLPVAACTSDDFDWNSFNALFSSRPTSDDKPASGAASGDAPLWPLPSSGGSLQLASPTHSSWARICSAFQNGAAATVAGGTWADASATAGFPSSGAGPSTCGAEPRAPRQPLLTLRGSGGTAPLFQLYREVSHTVDGALNSVGGALSEAGHALGGLLHAKLSRSVS